ncbi:hypothetical protein AB0K52_05210 [Glycomyces sp. NPDC049804]|uniref:hypothetical protein n=1 Tax=Glycomyces sp. NPDC049804 TaxID=3154363 RepID=UPI00342C57CC
MRRRAFAAASTAAVAGVVGGIAAASSASADNSLPAAPPSARPASETPVVGNTYGPGGEVHYDVEPATLVLGEFSTGAQLEWVQWGPDVAIATGSLRGLWIENEEGRYDDVTVTLFNVQNGSFTEWWATGPFEQPEHPMDFTHGYIPARVG